MLCLKCQHDYAVTNPLWRVNNDAPHYLENTALKDYGAIYTETNRYESTVCLNLTKETVEAITEWTVACVVGDSSSNTVSLKQWLPGEV